MSRIVDEVMRKIRHKTGVERLCEHAPDVSADIALDSLREELLSKYEIIVDTNLIIDVILERELFAEILFLCENQFMAVCAKSMNCDYIFTRNEKFFEGFDIPTVSPTDFLKENASFGCERPPRDAEDVLLS